MLKSVLTIGLVMMLASGVSAQLNMTFLGNYPYTPDLSDVWGYVDSLGNEYAIVGVQNGISVVDVTTPASPNEVFFISGPNTIWRDIKVWNKHAYVTNEASGGMKIIDLSNLPAPTSPAVATYTGSSYAFTKAHDLYIDENGVAYILGSNYSTGGAIMLDLTADPMNPTELGVFNNYYLHDAMVRGDTLWGGAINNGFFVAVDVSNKAAPIVLATQNTPNNFTHNCWISDDGNTLFTTDEKSGAFIASYDVSDLSNITELDRIQSNPGSGTIPHNTFFMNNFVITSYYRDGVTVHDVTRPGNMIQTGDYDTYPTGSGNGFNGAWGVYPWLPSGNVLVSDIESGLFILGPTYTRGCYLEGTVTDFSTSNSINNATIEILTGVETTTSDLLGEYAMAILTAGTYDVAFSAPGYTSDTLSAVLSNGVLTLLDAQLIAPVPFVLTGQVVESNGGAPIANADVLITNNDFQYPLTSDGGGNFFIPSFFQGTFDVIAGKWMYNTACSSMFIDTATGPIAIALDSGLYDDFSFDFGWGVSGNAASGTWERVEPVGTNYSGVGDANPDVDVSIDCYDHAYITGNGGGSAGNDDVDNGNTIIKSPLFDLTTYTEPYVKYYRWFFNDGGGGTPNDTLRISLSNGSVSVVLEEVTQSSAANSSWVSRSYKVSDYIAATNLMQLTIETADYAGSGHLVEAGLDMFRVDEFIVDLSSSNASCSGACDGDAVASVLGGVTPLSYLWDDPAAQTTDTAVGLCAGSFTAIIIDALGDTATAQVTITEPGAINLSTSTTALCNPSLSDVTVTAINGVAPYSYVWDDPGSQTTQTALDLSVGTYIVTVADNNGCSNTTSVTTTANTTLSVSTTSTDPTSCGGTDGTGTAVVVNGATPYTYEWNDILSQTTSVATGLGSGTYTVVVTDFDGCSDNGIVTINDPGSPVLSISNATMPLCNGGNDGSATVYVTGATGFYVYSWNTSPVQTDSTATGLAAGTYSVNVTVGGTCTGSISVMISEPSPISTNMATSNVLCFGEQTGTATVTAAGGTPSYIYSWDNGQMTAGAELLVAGTYSVTVTDTNGCAVSDQATISEPAALTASTIVTDVVCVGDSNGAIDLSPTGGVMPYTFNWSNGSSSEDVSNLWAGSYLLVLSDSNGCSVIENATLGTQSSGSQTSSITGPVILSQGATEFYAVNPNIGSVYNWTVAGGTQTGGGQGNNIIVQWDLIGTGQVAVVETDIMGCTGDTVFLNVSVATTISSMDDFQMEMMVYPNPNTGRFAIGVNSMREEIFTATIYDSKGQQLQSKVLAYAAGWHYGNIDLANRGAGMYYIRLASDRIFLSCKILVH